MSIERIVFTLADKFDQYDWDLEETTINGGMFCIFVNDLDFYKSKELKKWKLILRKKHPKVKWFCAFKKFKH